MANKKNTKRERREEAKQRRLEELRRRERRARMRKMLMAGAAAVVVAGIVVAVLLLGGDGQKKEELRTLAVAAGCAEIEKHASEGASHVDAPQTVTYKTNPPTSGNHYGSTTQTGIHTSPVQNENMVHNLEHGHMAIFYKADVDGQIVDALKEVARSDPRWVLVAPSTTIPSPIAFAAWENLQICNSPTTPAAVKAAAEGFLEEFKNKGPEPNLPGTPTGV